MNGRADRSQAADGVGSARGMEDTPLRPVLNWFGTIFGVVVLIGGSILYVAGVSEPTAGPDQPVAPQMAVDDHDEAKDTADEGSKRKGRSQEATSDDHPAKDRKGANDRDIYKIEMIDYGYVPETIDIKASVPVIFRFTNTGRFEHEAMIGDAHMQEEFHEADDHDDEGDGGHGSESEEGGDHHGDVMAVTVKPGETADLEVVIDEPGEWFVACHLPGHYEQGQIGTINVRA